MGMGSCVEELEIETLSGDGAGMLVVDAIFSDELKTQTVYLSRSDSRLDLLTDTIYNPYMPQGIQPFDSVPPESGALLKLLGDNGEEYNFTEGSEGHYLSNEPFALELDISYILQITTSSGTEYVSDAIQLAGTSEVINLYAEKAISDNGVEGVAIYLDSDPIEGSPENYRFAYEETYKIVAPYWQVYDFDLTNYDPVTLEHDLSLIERQVQNQTCYNTVVSSGIDQISTVGNSGADVQRHMVRFIGKDNFIISHRYSILVKQYVQSKEAYSFFEVLKDFSQSESLFSGVQPGALYANVKRADGTEENVLGYVEAVNVSEQRLFFNYEDYFPDEELPPYAFGFNCDLQTAPLFDLPDCPQGLLPRVELGLVSYFAAYDENLVPLAACVGPYVFVPRLCGDCTLLGDNVVPDFWID
ncbi:hypothetical protein Musp01_16480 [Muricauda sp. NBRC 101325]|nr:hypothetical protein Musp01_16480 [Muricauda sp. NBRC 101325]